MWHWNNVKRSAFDFFVMRDTDGTHNQWNGRSEVYLDNSLSLPTLAVTIVRYHCFWFFGWHYELDETDMGFNNNVTWNLNPLDYSNLGLPFSFEGVALHELGHALGLNHEDRWLATLNSNYPAAGTMGHWREWDPTGDDREGARFMYPDRTSEVDIAGSVFTSIGGGSSALVTSPVSAARGSTIRIQFTFSNLSTSTQTFDIGFYLSSNDFISKFDRLLGTNSGAWGNPGFTGSFFRSLTIPADVAPGQYWLGFIVDNAEGVGEANEVNNNMEMPRPIQIN
ncbi:hypothetical protein AA309_25535 [Microvirga vignae]|uniref:Peptidase M10 metallopeptidase domain-containing protein n=2 Tax=Microvirga vignae TaxID=1225564 RepID=A0A0H1R6K5_9HYPH|nr:hypothetical protein AA309_25535 [Microvirga vignae]